MRIEFTPALMTGNAEIDRQHRELIHWCNVLSDPDSPAVHADLLRQVLDYVIGYVDLHFSAEERVMESAGYPGLTSHCKGHAYFKREVGRLRHELPTVDSVRAATLQLHYLIRDWFLQHIRQADVALAAWLSEHAPDLEVPRASEGVEALLRASGISFEELDAMRVVLP